MMTISMTVAFMMGAVFTMGAVGSQWIAISSQDIPIGFAPWTGLAEMVSGAASFERTVLEGGLLETCEETRWWRGEGVTTPSFGRPAVAMVRCG